MLTHILITSKVIGSLYVKIKRYAGLCCSSLSGPIFEGASLNNVVEASLFFSDCLCVGHLQPLKNVSLCYQSKQKFQVISLKKKCLNVFRLHKMQGLIFNFSELSQFLTSFSQVSIFFSHMPYMALLGTQIHGMSP